MPVKMIGLAELEMDMAEIVNRALTDSQTITVPDDSMLPRLEALAILEAEKFADALTKELDG